MWDKGQSNINMKENFPTEKYFGKIIMATIAIKQHKSINIAYL